MPERIRSGVTLAGAAGPILVVAIHCKRAPMSQQHPIAVQNFSHICVGVSDIEASMAFYNMAVLGMDVVFDVELKEPHWAR